MIIKFKKLSKDAVVPTFGRIGDAAFDLYSTHNLVLKKGKIGLVKTGLSSEFTAKYFVNVKDRSGLALNHGIHTMGGVIDSNYRGEWGMILINLGSKDYKIKKGDRIAQAVVFEIPKVIIRETEKLKGSERDKSGFGSSGR